MFWTQQLKLHLRQYCCTQKVAAMPLCSIQD